jgi:hypothetical protein
MVERERKECKEQRSKRFLLEKSGLIVFFNEEGSNKICLVSCNTSKIIYLNLIGKI